MYMTFKVGFFLFLHPARAPCSSRILPLIVSCCPLYKKGLIMLISFCKALKTYVKYY